MINALSQHRWSGNVRELENVIQRFVVLGNEKAIIEELTPVIQEDSIPGNNKKIVPAEKGLAFFEGSSSGSP